jgi:hypothetical protein
MVVEVRVDQKHVRVRTWVTPKSKQTWTATLFQERRIAWRGKVKRGELDYRLAKLTGAETVGVRLASSTGTICATEIVVPGF